MTTELTKAAQQALEALSLALSDVDRRGNSPTQPVLHKAYNSLQSALTQRPAAQSEAQALAHNMMLWREDAVHSGNEYVPVHVRTLEKAIAQLRNMPAPQQATPEPVPFSHAGHFYNLVGHALMEVKRPDACAYRLRLILDELAALMGQPATPEPVGEPLQGGLDNDALLNAWRSKLPGVTPTDAQMTAFALGVEVGFAHARTLERSDWSRVHEALQAAGVHPGRTDDHLADVIAKALANRPAPVENEPVGEPAFWVLTKQLQQRETTTRGYMWFSNPQNDCWTPVFTRPAPGVPEGLPAVLTDWGFDVHGDEEGRTWLTIRNPDDDVARMSVPTVWPLNGNQTIGAVVLHQFSAALSAALAAAQAKGGEK